MKQLFSVHGAKAYIFRLVRSGIDFTVSDITDRYDISDAQVHELCKAHMGDFGKTAIFDRRIQLLSDGSYRHYGHMGDYMRFPEAPDGIVNPFLKRDEVFRDANDNPVGMDGEGNYLGGDVGIKVEKRIGFLYPAMRSDEVTVLHTMTYTSDGRFRPECMETTPSSLGVFDLVEHFQMKQKGELPYDLFIIDVWRSGAGMYHALKDVGLPVMTMQDAFLAIDCKVSEDVINSTPNLYAPKPKGKIPGSYRTALYDESALLHKQQDRLKREVVVPMSLNGESVEVEVL